MKKITICLGISALTLTACAAMSGFPGWEQVKSEETVHLKPCSLVKENYDSSGLEQNAIKKMAIYFGANTAVSNNFGSTNFFKCSPGLPLYTDPQKVIWVANDKFKAGLTQVDLEKATAKCTYETNKATIDTSQPNPTRIFVPTGNLNYDQSQTYAIHHDAINSEIRSIKLDIEKDSLFKQCMATEGFVDTRIVEDEKSLSDLHKNCPGIDNKTTPCLMPQ